VNGSGERPEPEQGPVQGTRQRRPRTAPSTQRFSSQPAGAG